MSCFINSYTDFGFKKLFGEETNKDLLIDFLNQLLMVAERLKQQGKSLEKIMQLTGLTIQELNTFK